MVKNDRGGFGSKFGMMMTVAGSAVGLGNIWRFPFLAGENGGAAFIIIYLSLVLVIGIPLVLSEFSIGTAAKAGAILSYKKLAPKTKWHYNGYLTEVTGYLLLGFYCVVAGWTLRFFYESVAVGFDGQSATQIKESFEGFTSTWWQSTLAGLIFVAMCAYVVIRGIEKGIEKWNKFLMPLLFASLIFLCINSMTLDGWEKGMEFMFSPDWSEVTGQTIIDALGQVFFTLSLGMGVMITYSSYSKGDDNMVKSKVTVSVIDTSVAILSGIAIFPAVFSIEGLQPTQGPELVFLTLPSVFANLSYGWIVAILFFFMLSIAALTSAISIMEMLVTLFIERYGITRRRATFIIVAIMAVLTLLCALSSEIFNLFDMLTANYLMPIGALLIALFVGFAMDKKLRYNTFTSNGKYSRWIYPIFLFIVRYVAPLAIVIIILNGVGLI